MTAKLASNRKAKVFGFKCYIFKGFGTEFITEFDEAKVKFQLEIQTLKDFSR